MCSVDDADPWAVCRTQTPRARKPKPCDECTRTINVGETYHLLDGLMDDTWSQWRWCRHCEAAGQWLRTACGGYILGSMLDELDEHWSEGYQSEPFRLLIADMRAGWDAGRAEVPINVGDLARSMMRAMVAA